ncbi:MAG: branched-chain amino acid ABC transporter permease, partial [Pseudomonadota bacterium]
MAEISSHREMNKTSLGWFLHGAKQLFSIPALILIMSFVGFGGLTAETGMSVWQAMFLAVSTWALPSAVVVAGAILTDVPFYATVFAVALASIRLMPM